MKTRVFNVLVMLAGVAAQFGYKIDLTPEQLMSIAGAVVAVVGFVNQLAHEAAPSSGPPAAVSEPPKT